MSFLTPLFLVGLAGLAIPVLLHLIQREKKQVVAFPSLMFVRRIPYQSVRRRRIHNWLLLIVRLSAMALIVAAFARPFLPAANAASALATGARELVVLLDNSYSMGYGDRWDRARAAARQAIETLGPSDRGSVVLFASRADIALRSTADRGRLQSAVGVAELSAGATRYAPALQVAASILAESSLPRKEAILITDFQRGGWRGAEEGGRLPDGATLTTVAIGGGTDAPNLATTAVALARSEFSTQERVAVTAGVLNRSAKPVKDVELTLDIGGRTVQTERVSVEPNGSASVTFAPVTVDSRRMRGTVRTGADALARDNAFHFVVSPSEPLRLVVVERDAAAGAASLYLHRALAIGESPRFEVVTRQASAVSEDDVNRAAAIILNDVPVTAALGDRLARFVERGGGLFIAAGARATWPEARRALMPAALVAPVDRSRGAAVRVSAVEYGHPVFELFRAPRSGDFSAGRFYGYRGVVIDPATTSLGAEAAPAAKAAVVARSTSAAAPVAILARFDTGAPALLERTVGKGRVLLWTSTLDLSWSDLPLKPVFLPFMHRVVRHLASYSEPAPWLTVGQVLDPSAARGAGPTSAARVALTPSGKRVALDDEGAGVLELAEQGFYEIRRQSSDADGDVVAANVDLAESDLTTVDPQDIVAAAAGRAGGGQAGGAEIPLAPEAQERTQRVWWYLLALGILLLGADTLLSNRLSKA